MTERRRRNRLLIGLAAAALTGCGGSVRVPEDSFYRLDIPAPAAAQAAPAIDGTLRVEVDAAAPVYRDRSLLYSTADAPARLQRYHYHHWIDAPPRLLEQRLADYLRAAGVASQVVARDDRLDGRYRLRLQLRRFEHQRGRDGGRVSLAVELLLSDGAGGGLLLRERIRAERPVAGDAFPAVIEAYRQCVADAFGQVRAMLEHL
ncbi:MAG: ABC-type transport auxiliary lipoprotein family protein [Pseudomonadota bacterium]